MTTPPNPRREIRDQVVRIADLVVITTLIEHTTFTNCRIIGPAVIALLEDVNIGQCRWETPDVQALFWVVPPDRTVLIGAIGVRDCEFVDCSFAQVGVAGSAEIYKQFDQSFTRVD